MLCSIPTACLRWPSETPTRTYIIGEIHTQCPTCVPLCLKAIVTRYKRWLFLYLDLVYGEPRINLVLNRACTKLKKTSLQGQSKAYGSDTSVDEQLDRCFCLPLELLSIVAAALCLWAKGDICCTICDIKVAHMCSCRHFSLHQSFSSKQQYISVCLENSCLNDFNIHGHSR